MQIISDPKKDTAKPRNIPGGYEWWYFDALDAVSEYSFVVIFYLGNPFSNRYIRQLEKDPLSGKSYPGQYPAVSISVYKGQSPVYYSFTEFDKEISQFSPENAALRIDGHTLKQNTFQNKLSYKLELQEKLPSGDSINANLSFSSPDKVLPLTDNKSEEKEGHCWNLVQPKAEVEGNIRLFRDSVTEHDIYFGGVGYHDHNTGREPMKDEFSDWYWGRFHFDDYTLVYYAMNKKDDQQYQAFLIDGDSNAIVHNFRSMVLKDRGLTIFGLKPARKIIMKDENVEVVIQHSRVLDNGPFYQRFLSDAYLSINENAVQKSKGISEYIYPSRIYKKLFWPLVDMRIRYKNEKPHWVQKSKKLYRWTW